MKADAGGGGGQCDAVEVGFMRSGEGVRQAPLAGDEDVMSLRQLELPPAPPRGHVLSAARRPVVKWPGIVMTPLNLLP